MVIRRRMVGRWGVILVALGLSVWVGVEGFCPHLSSFGYEGL
jgi:hypothetical protein